MSGELVQVGLWQRFCLHIVFGAKLDEAHLGQGRIKGSLQLAVADGRLEPRHPRPAAAPLLELHR